MFRKLIAFEASSAYFKVFFLDHMGSPIWYLIRPGDSSTNSYPQSVSTFPPGFPFKLP